MTKASDIWALGCLFYQLAFKDKVFLTDFTVYDYAYSSKKPEIRLMPVNQRTAASFRELIYRTLEIDWWKRPTATDVTQLLDSLSTRNTSDWVFSIYEEEPKSGYSSSNTADQSSNSVPLHYSSSSICLNLFPNLSP